MSKPSESKKTNLTYFEKQRDLLIAEITTSMDSVITNINTLNRSLKANIAVGKEFEVVAEQWKGFYDSLSHLEQVRSHQEKLKEQEQTTIDESQRTADLNVDTAQEEIRTGKD